MNNRQISIIALLLFSACLSAQVSDSTTVIEANGAKMSKAEFEALVAGQEGGRVDLSKPEMRKPLGLQMGKAFALEAEAKRRKMDQDKKIQLKIRAYTLQVMAAELVEELRDDYLTKDEAKLKAYYEKNQSSYSRPRVRQILVRTKGSPLALRPGMKDLTLEEARAKVNALHQQLLAGADFAKLAATESYDFDAKVKGGDLGFVTRGTSGANFAAAAFSLPINKISEPIQTEFGFHIIRVEERQPEPFAGIKKALATELANKDLEAIALKGYKLNEAYFGK